ncbi:MAG: hypothetical protein K8R76_01460, partial [Candidatus Aegiribacteria sp.]|nr:hypothetical protein [Candidatus Aegiribacteria sp.]
MTDKKQFAVIFLAFTAILILNALIYMPFLSDDALISMRYSRRLASGNGLTWTDGPRVEGYSNLLWVLLTAAGVYVGIDGVVTVRLLGILSMVGFIFSVLFTYRKNSYGVYMVVLLFAVLSAPIAVWTIGGLEQPLVAVLVALSIPLLWRIIDRRKAGAMLFLTSSIPLAFLCITRPDGVLFTFAAVLVLLFSGHGRKSFLLALLPALFILFQLGFRLSYYGDYLPNTARIKIHPSVHYIFCGMKYVLLGTFVLFPLSLFSLAATVIAIRKKHTRTLLPAAMALLWIIYLILIGGDSFPAYRHFVPLIVLFTYISIEELRQIKIRRFFSTVMVASAALLLFIVLQFTNSRNRTAREERWEWDGQVIALVLKEAFEEKEPLLAVTAAGTLPYWSELPSLDMLGLNDRYLAMNQGESEVEGLLGHNVCNPDYILERKPDIISFNAAGEPTGFALAEDLSASEEFGELYRQINIRGTRPYTHQGLLWFNTESPLIGIEKTADSIVIPAYFFNMYEHTFMHTQNGIPGITITANMPAGIVLTDISSVHEWIPGEQSERFTVTLQVIGDSLIVELSTKDTRPIFIETVALT